MQVELDNSASEAQAGEFEDIKGGGQIDYKEIFQKTDSELKETRSTLDDTRTELTKVRGETEATRSTIDKLRAALRDESEASPGEDPIKQVLSALDREEQEIIAAAEKAEKRGQPIPLTARNALKNIELQRDIIKKHKAYESETKELRAKVDRLSNPQTTMESIAANNMESQLVSALETIYGPSEEYTDIKESQRASVSNLVIKEIKRLQATEPKTWERIIRDQKAQKSMINHYVQQTIPPRARQLMEDDNIKREPLKTDELVEAWRDAKTLGQKDPKFRKESEILRQEVLSSILQEQMGKRGKLNKVYSSRS